MGADPTRVGAGHGGAAWWTGKARQTLRYLTGRVTAAERQALVGWLAAPELALFDAMHRADRRHGLDVLATLRAEGVADRDLLVAGLLHDAGKGDTGLAPRIVHALAVAYGPGIARAAAALPGMAAALGRMRDHAEASAEMARAAGCSPRIVELIRWQEAPRDAVGERLRLADEAN